MTVRIFDAVAHFKAVRYNTNKIDKGKGDLLKVANFGPLMGFGEKRPQDYRSYLEAVSALNKNVKKPVFHAMISAGGKTHTKEQLLEIAEKWMVAMGYGDQPYMALFHKDTKNNHIHLVSTRVDKQGKKIDDSFEKVRAIRELNKIMGVQPDLDAKADVAKALSYQFSTRAQFAMLLEASNYKIREKGSVMEVIKYGGGQNKVALAALDNKIGFYQTDKNRALELKSILLNYRAYYKLDDLKVFLKQKFNIELVFHAKDGKPPYGYTVIDHAQQRVFKGGEILALKELLGHAPEKELNEKADARSEKQSEEKSPAVEDIYLPPVFIAQDVDDEAVYGRKRRKKRNQTR